MSQSPKEASPLVPHPPMLIQIPDLVDWKDVLGTLSRRAVPCECTVSVCDYRIRGTAK